MRQISLEDILFLHYMIIEDFGGMHGIRDEKRLASTVKAPFQHVFGKDLYPTEFDKAALYIKSIVADHPFVDGNKRTAITVAGIFLVNNGHVLTVSPIELADYAVSVATKNPSVAEISAWLKANCS